jgi:hypothetical protein
MAFFLKRLFLIVLILIGSTLCITLQDLYLARIKLVYYLPKLQVMLLVTAPLCNGSRMIFKINTTIGD